jgi:hypothetical protein
MIDPADVKCRVYQKQKRKWHSDDAEKRIIADKTKQIRGYPFFLRNRLAIGRIKRGYLKR